LNLTRNRISFRGLRSLHQSYARFAPSLLNNEAEIDLALAEIHAMA
jgi:hypothetical protein